MSNICSLKNISYSYHTKLGETKVLENLNFDLKEGELLGLVGPSGSGKSTILSLISNLIAPEKGEIIFKDGKEENRCGYMLQRDELFPWRNVLSNINLGLEIKHIKDKSYGINLLKKYNLYDFKDVYPDQLSRGMRQRVALIRTLNLKPSILLLDEPFSALDYETRINLADDVHRIIKNENKSAIFVTHDIPEAISLSDRIVLLSKRPAKIEKEFNLDIFLDKAPSLRRKDARFLSYQENIYEHLKNLERKNE